MTRIAKTIFSLLLCGMLMTISGATQATNHYQTQEWLNTYRCNGLGCNPCNDSCSPGDIDWYGNNNYWHEREGGWCDSAYDWSGCCADGATGGETCGDDSCCPEATWCCCGYDDQYVWTQNDETTKANYMIWDYWIYSHNAYNYTWMPASPSYFSTESAQYLFHRSGTDGEIWLNQYYYNNTPGQSYQFVYLMYYTSQYSFEITDVTGEEDLTTRIGFDEYKITF